MPGLGLCQGTKVLTDYRVPNLAGQQCGGQENRTPQAAAAVQRLAGALSTHTESVLRSRACYEQNCMCVLQRIL